MRVHGFIVVGLTALVLSGCAGMPRKKAGVLPPPPALRTTIADVRTPMGPASAPILPASAPVMPAAAVAVQPAVVAPVAIAVSACAPVYTLDSGDRLRIMVFGQEGLSNIYAVDA